jgi:folate-dependent phosphoribosylglycinamide formyltransferase PurN
VIIATQDDGFVIPGMVERVCDEAGVEVVAILSLTGGGSVESQRWKFLRGFGIWQAFTLYARLFVERFSGPARAKTLRRVAVSRGIPFEMTGDVNGASTIEQLRALGPDVIVSFSAPVVFGPALLKLPRLACINLHCSLLPRYAGLMPSFWVLYHGERETGATVHEMDTQIDNGAILGQVRVALIADDTVSSVISKTKAAGLKVVLDVLRQMRHGAWNRLPNDRTTGSYHTWPSLDEIRAFRRRGGRLA